MTSTRNEEGFSLVVVIIALTIGSLLTIAAIAAATGDLPSARKSQDRKAAYAAAESGLDYYKYKLSLNNDLWKTCYGTTKTVPDTNESYTITPLPANGQTACSTGAPEASMIDTRNGSFRIRSTGTAGGVKRTLVATFRRKSFLDFIYYTTFETQDPPLYGSSPSPSWAAANCQRPRASRPDDCVDIQFASGDHINGPLHTDDDLLVCGGTTFGRDDRDPPDQIEVSGPRRAGTAPAAQAARPRRPGTARCCRTARPWACPTRTPPWPTPRTSTTTGRRTSSSTATR